MHPIPKILVRNESGDVVGAGDTDRAGDGAVELATETQRHRAGSGDELGLP